MANKDRFNFDSIEEDTQLRNISVQTVSNRDSFEISAEKVEQSEAPQIEDAYQLYEINTSADDTEIEQTSIEFEVNRSFAENYDNITLARHNDGWEQLPTKPVETTGEKWLYQASSTGFSYYAVQGINNQETGDTENNSDTNQTREGGEDNQTEQPENQTPQQNTDQTKDSVNEGYGQSDITLWFILPAVAVILLITYFGYSVRKKS